MKLQYLTVIFIIIIVPIILILSYYISLQIDTSNMQTSYNSKLLDATKEAIEAFEINTVEWNEDYSQTGDSKRRDVMASINTFTTTFANSLGIGGTSSEDILTYVPAIAFTLYDGYYIYSPTETKEVVTDDNGVAVYMTETLSKSGMISSDYNYNTSDEGKLLYVCDSKETPTGTYNNTISFTFDTSKAAVSEDSHILKPFSSYSARYKTTYIDITVNYTLDNYITIYGTVDNTKGIWSGYLINSNSNDDAMQAESLSEYIWYEGADSVSLYPYVYAEDNTKVYFETNSNNEVVAFQVSSTGTRTNLKDKTSVTYKKLAIENSDNNNYYYIYQALCGGSVKTTDENGDPTTKEIEQGQWYKDKNGNEFDDNDSNSNFEISDDVSAINYYVEATAFTSWVTDKLGEIEISDMEEVAESSETENSESENGNKNESENDKIFNINNNNDPEDEGSLIAQHKREIIKQKLISDLNQAITAYSRKSEGEYQLPVLTETDWDQILRNVSIVTFVQNIPIGMKYYNNYAVATSTANKEYINPDEIYLTVTNTNTDTDTDTYYHLLGCNKIITSDDTSIIGYRNIDYVIKSYENNDTTNYYYKHTVNQACYYCIVQRSLYSNNTTEQMKTAYKIALARERYNNRTTRLE